MSAPGSAKQFTASAIANALGITPQAVRDSLRGFVPDGGKIVGGEEAAAWSVAIIPQPLRKRLDKAAGRSGYGYADAMLLAPHLRPALPLQRISEKDLDYAQKLRMALRPWLVGDRGADLPAGEIVRLGLLDYERVFGRSISGRYWRELRARAIQRDGGAKDWNRLELYLPNSPAPKAEPSGPVSEELAERLGNIESYVRACSNPTDPSETEKRGVWTLALEGYVELVRAGTPAKRAARLVREYLCRYAPFLVPSRDGLLKAFNRNLQDLEKANGDPKALRDGRESNGNRFDFAEDDRDKLVHRAVFIYRGDVETAYRDLLRAGFSDALKERHPVKPGRRPRLPASIMDSVRAEVEILTIMHQGPRAFDAIKGYIDRTYDGIASCVCFMADDFTMPVYFYVEDGQGWFRMTRGQILVFIDFRSLRIVGWSMQPDRNYNSLVIRSLCTHVFAEHGIPEVLYFERGIWESSSLLVGRNPVPFEFTEIAQGLREFGIRFINAIRPRSKTVERVGGMLQDLMEAEPGYCGRNERVDAPESLRKQMAEIEPRSGQRSAKVHPSRYFHSYEEWNRRFGEIVDQYNATEQEGKILRGLSPDAAFAKLANPDDSPMRFGARQRFLFAHDKRPVRVTLNGVTFRVGKQTFNYKSKEISHLVNEPVLRWFDPENPEIIVVTDMQRKNPICVGRTPQVSALECITDPDSGRLAEGLKLIEDQASYMKAKYHAVRSKYPMPQRTPIVDAKTMQLGEEIQEETARLKEKNRRNEQAVNRARRMGVSAAFVDGDPEAAEALATMQRLRREHSSACNPGGPQARSSGPDESGPPLAESDRKGETQ
jgi:hypothetical protein